MASRVGLDLVAVSQVQGAIAEHGAAYLDRVYTAREVLDCTVSHRPDPSRLAARFAAKEATLKVLRTTEGLAWTSIEVLRRPPGYVEIALHGRAAQVAAEAGLSGFAVSLTHEAGLAMAVVTAETAGQCRCTCHENRDPPGSG